MVRPLIFNWRHPIGMFIPEESSGQIEDKRHPIGMLILEESFGLTASFQLAPLAHPPSGQTLIEDMCHPIGMFQETVTQLYYSLFQQRWAPWDCDGDGDLVLPLVRPLLFNGHGHLWCAHLQNRL